jgi:hypothetical protein
MIDSLQVHWTKENQTKKFHTPADDSWNASAGYFQAFVSKFDDGFVLAIYRPDVFDDSGKTCEPLQVLGYRAKDPKTALELAGMLFCHLLSTLAYGWRVPQKLIFQDQAELDDYLNDEPALPIDLTAGSQEARFNL